MGIIAALGVVLVPLLLIALIAAPRVIDEWVFEYRLTRTPGVVSVEKYFKHEDLRFADLKLRSGRYLSLAGFDSSAFTKTSSIGLRVIGDRHLVCSTDSSGDPGLLSINVVEYSKSYMGNDVKNISDTIEHYEELRTSLANNLDDLGKKLKPLKLSGEYVWCRLARSDS